jgi:hypothetical protein
MAALNFCFVLHTREKEREKKIVIKFEAAKGRSTHKKVKNLFHFISIQCRSLSFLRFRVHCTYNNFFFYFLLAVVLNSRKYRVYGMSVNVIIALVCAEEEAFFIKFNHLSTT